jgi:hypothetical protein
MHAMAQDTRRKRIVLYGGGENADDLWEWDGSHWQRIMPPAR